MTYCIYTWPLIYSLSHKCFRKKWRQLDPTPLLAFPQLISRILQTSWVVPKNIQPPLFVRIDRSDWVLCLGMVRIQNAEAVITKYWSIQIHSFPMLDCPSGDMRWLHYMDLYMRPLLLVWIHIWGKNKRFHGDDPDSWWYIRSGVTFHLKVISV